MGRQQAARPQLKRDSLDGGAQTALMPRESWTTFEPAAFSLVRDSGCTYELPRQDWPPWTQRAPQVQRIFVYALAPGEAAPSIHTTATVVGRLLTERHDPKDEAPYNYNWYAVVQSSNGALYQSGPHRDIDFGHHLSQAVSTLTLGITA